MPFPIALTSPDYSKLRAGGHKANEYLVLGSNTTVFAARVNQSTFATSFGQLIFDTVTTGAYTSILEGMTVLISATNDKRAAYFVGRVRADSSGVVSTTTILNVNETSATIADNDYIFVIRDYRLFHELGRYTGGVYYKDYARTFTALKPVISGLQSTYAGIVSGSPAGFTVSFAASATAATASATISSYLYTIPTGGTVTAGSVSTASVTVRFDASATEYWVKLVVTDSGGRTQTRYISVFAIPADLSTTITLGAGGANITGDIDSGWSATVDAFAGFTSVLDNTLAVILDVEYYDTTQTSLVSSVKFVGRMRSDDNATKTDEKISISRKAQVEIEGTAAQMTRITTPLITMRDSSAAAVWDEITKLTVWRSVCYLLEHSTFHNLYSLSFDSTADTYYAYQLLAPQGNMLSAVNDLLKSINGAIEFAPTGEARAVRNLNFLSEAERAVLVTVANFEMQDNLGLPSLQHQHSDTVGVVEASGGTYYRNGGISPNVVVPLLSIAPGVAQGNAEGVSPLPSQILTANVSAATAQDELNTRAGNQFAYANGNDQLNVDLRTGYNWLVPSRYQYYTWTIDAGDTTFGRAYTTDNKWWCKSVSIRHENETGTKQVSAVFILETSGADAGAGGQTVDIPPPGDTAPILPYIPPINPYPYFPTDPFIFTPTTPSIPYLPPYTAPPATTNGVPVTGDADIIWNTTQAWVTRSFLTIPKWIPVTPELDAGYTIRHCALVGTRAYLLASDGTNSKFYTNSNVFGNATEWSTGTTLLGEYSHISTTSTNGALYVLGATTTGGNCADDWAVSTTGTELSRTGNTITAKPVQVGATGRLIISATGYSAGPEPPTTLDRWVSRNVDAGTAPDIISGWFRPGDSYPGGEQIGLWGDRCIWWLDTIWTTYDPASVVTFTLSDDSGCGTCSTGGSAVATAYSTDFGATFASAVSVGSSVLGIDTIKVGTTVLAGASGQVRKATTGGGAYSDYGSAMPAGGTQPTAIYIPRFVFGSTTSANTGSNPEFLVASSVLGTGNKALWKVTASGATYTDITPVVGGFYGLAIGSDCIWMPWWSGSIIFAVLSFNGTPRLVYSTNSGTSWTDKGVLSSDAKMVIGRRGDKTMQSLFLANQSPAYSKNRGTSIVSKTFPADAASDPILGILPYG